MNSGSSTVKFALLTLAREPSLLCRGTLDEAPDATTVDRVAERVGDRLAGSPPAAVGHRLVHGGPSLSDPQLATDQLLATLAQLVHFAPNHLPGEIQLIEASRRRWPDVAQVVCFDTAFHAALPDVARRLPIPTAYSEQGIRRYGFHGLSYTFLFQQLRERAGPSQANGNVVLMHLGNGSSLAAVQAGRSIDTSMGFTPIGGVVMGTRCGDIDPGVVTYIARATGADADRVERVLSQESGLAGISGGVHDMRELLAREPRDEACRLAVAIYCYEIKKQVGAYAAALGGLDALVFSGGIGEHAPAIRARICRGLAFLGVELDDRLNEVDAPLVSSSTSRVAIHVIPTDEELVIAQAAYQAIDGHP
jgi:acetate kinase